MPPIPTLQTREFVPFADDLARHGDLIALRSVDRTLTYRELDAEVDRMTPLFGGHRRLVLITASNSPAAVIGYLAALRAGHVVLLTGAGNPDHHETLIDRFDPDVTFDPTTTEAQIVARRTGSAHDLHPDLALLLSTSGSTGAAKLVRLSYDNLAANAAAIAEYLGITAADCAITALPMQYCYGLSVIHSHLASGASLALTSDSVTDDSFWRLFRSANATSLAGVPHTYELLERVGFDATSVPSLRYLTQAGGRMAPDAVRRWAARGTRDGWDFVVMYGQTEATARMAWLPATSALENPSSIGVAIPGGTLHLDLDESASQDCIGELVYTGPNVMLGYAESPSDLSLGRTVHELRTGDRARVNANGMFEIVGRRSRFVKVFGLRLDLDRVEQTIRSAGVECIATGEDDTLVVAVLDAADEALVRTAVRREFGLSLGSVHTVVVANFPRLSNGKPDYRTIASLAAGEVAQRPQPSDRRRDVRTQIAQAFTDVLGVDAPANADTFTTLGGDSLSYIEMSIRLEEILGVLPNDWHLTPFGRLTDGTPPAPSSTAPRMARARWRGRQVEVTMPIRALAILLIVGGHMGLWEWDGGAHILMAAAGFSFARFQLTATRTRAGIDNMVRSLVRIAVPAVLFIGAMAALGLRWRGVNVLLVNDYFGSASHPKAWELWFIEALVTLLGAFTLLFSVAPVRALERRNPFGFACAVLTAGLAIRFTLSAHDDWNPDASRPHSMLWLFALGWAAQCATTVRQRLALTCALGASVWELFSDEYRNVLILLGVAALIWATTIRLPRALVRPAASIASASLWIYLTHWQVFPPLVGHGMNRILTFPVVIAAGVATWRCVRPATAFAERLAIEAFGKRRQDLVGDGDGLADAFGELDTGAELRALRYASVSR